MMQQYLVSFISSFGVHIAIGFVLFFSFEITPPPQPQVSNNEPDIVKAVSIDKTEMQKQVKRIEAQQVALKKAEEKRVKDLERRAERAESKLNSNQKQIKDLTQQKKKAQQEADAAKELQIKEAKRAKELKKQAEAQEQAKAQAEQEAQAAKQRADDAKKREQALIAERKRKALEAQEKAELEKQMAEQLAVEQAARQKAKQKQILTERQKYQALIRNTIQQHLLVDETFKGKSCKLNIKLAASGFVIGVKKLAGDERLCVAAERAVIKAETVPVSQDPDVFAELKNINLTVEPIFK
ncbi:cell envelope integrity protein TolA [Algibacillus agarilyticus]|uniref:cell envelope integrity protein TolA n=1 Tax=Algibacillus agarilyticus TaxID=2234133 RepID=UPI001E4E97B8|nr:cell envelope integrity protein TolA [Algibacillus agarilyticus]